MEHLNLTRRQLSNIVAFILIMSFFIFIFGYYLGKKDFKKSRNSSSGDKNKELKLNYNLDIDNNKKNNSLDNNNLNFNLEKKISEDKSLKNNKKLHISFYYAELSGFGKLRYAKKYEQEILKGFSVMTIERVGKASNGDVRKWYQVVTKPQVDINELNSTVDQIKKLAKLKDVRVLKLSSKQKEDLQTKVV